MNAIGAGRSGKLVVWTVRLDWSQLIKNTSGRLLEASMPPMHSTPSGVLTEAPYALAEGSLKTVSSHLYSPLARRSRTKIDSFHTRSEARRVGNEGVSTCRSRWSP